MPWLVAGVGLGTGMVHPQDGQGTEDPAEAELGLTFGMLTFDAAHPHREIEHGGASVPDRPQLGEGDMPMHGAQHTTPLIVGQACVET